MCMCVYIYKAGSDDVAGKIKKKSDSAQAAIVFYFIFFVKELGGGEGSCCCVLSQSWLHFSFLLLLLVYKWGCICVKNFERRRVRSGGAGEEVFFFVLERNKRK